MSDDDSDQPDMPARHSVFATTHWSVVLAVGHEDSALAMEALERLCQTYWYPLYAYLRRRGYAEHDAQDKIQGFFALLLKRQSLQKMKRGGGKFRSYLLTALNHYLIDEHNRGQAQKRGGGQPVLSLDTQDAEQHYQLEPQDHRTPEVLFERRWALTVIDAAMARLEMEFAADGKISQFERLRGFIVAGVDNRPYAEVAEQIGMSEEAVRKAVQRLRRGYRDAVREEIAQTVATVSEIEEELRYLLAVLSS